MKKKRNKIAEVAIGVPVPGPFHYLIPSNLEEDLQVGERVWVPFRNRLKVGYIVNFVGKSKVPKLRRIREVIDPNPILSQEILKITKWVADYYCSSWGEAIEAALPGPLKKGRTAVRRRKLSSPEAPERAFPDPIAASEVERKIVSVPDCLLDCLEDNRFEVFLAVGNTAIRVGLYFQAIARALKLGRTCILLVPEISLIPQRMERLRPLVGEQIALLHSGLSSGERFRQWQKIKDGSARIVVGARSAVFSPVANLGLIVVDEEHEPAYKQDDAPRYNARDVAIARAKENKACVILGSRAPSLESYHNAKIRRYRLINLVESREGQVLPSVRIVDMRRQPGKKKGVRIFSRVLEDAIKDRLIRGESIVLFLNRRGFSTFISCKGCGFVLRCESCRVSLTYHFYRKKLVCHYCNYHQELSEICPECKGRYLSYVGIGTQKVESEVCRIFPEASVARVDLDTARQKKTYQRILSDFRCGKIDILVGTQLVAGIAGPIDAGLIGVISADFLLNLPDFRSSERTLQLLAQLAERFGAGAEMIIQTYNPTHHSICTAKDHDFERFFKEEIRSRRELGYPPYFHLVNLTLRGKKKEKVIGAAKALAKDLKKKRPKNMALLGPAPLPIPKLRGSFRWHLILKCKEVDPMNKHLRNVLGNFKVSGGVRLTVDVDPVSML